MLVADAERDRHRHDSAEDRRPEGVDELLVVAEEQDQLVAAAGAEALQVIEDAERALVELGEADLVRVALPLEVGDAARHRAIRLDELDEGRDLLHQRRSRRMRRGWRVRRLICASSSRGWSGT